MKANIQDIILSSSAALLLLSIGVGTLLPQASDFSEEENRMLATLSAPTLSDIADGAFFASVSDYCRDRLPLRTRFTALKAYAELALAKGENNGIIFAADGYLLDKGEYESLTVAEKNLAYFSELASRFEASGTHTVLAYAPRGIDVMKSKLPKAYRGNEDMIWQLAQSSSDSLTDLTSPLRSAAESGEYVWYKTDHHWTARGAYIAYRELSRPLGYIPRAESFFDIQQASDSFLGSIYSKVGCVAPSADTVELYRYGGDGDYTLRIDGKEVGSGLYFTEKLNAKDKYAVYLGGNYASATVERSNGEKRERLLVIKDSYFNSLLPLLALHYDVELIDLRYSEESEDELAEKAKSADKALILLGIDTVATYPFS